MNIESADCKLIQLYILVTLISHELFLSSWFLRELEMETYLQGFADPTETEYSCCYKKLMPKYSTGSMCSWFKFSLRTHLVGRAERFLSPCFALGIEQHVAALTITLTHQYIW